jgi:hypothetical protein
MVSLISSTTTVTGLSVKCRLDHRLYHTGKKVSDEVMKTIKLKPAKFGDWNYTIEIDLKL